MIYPPLSFRRDHHWRELSPKEGRRRWRFEYLMEVPHRMEKDLGGRVELCDATGKPWVVLDGYWWITQPGYQWNGCSPKRHVPLLGWVGTPDVVGDENGFGGNLLASGWHDQARQFSSTEFIAKHFSVKQIDLGFRRILRLTGYPHAELFYGAVAMAAPMWPHQEEGQFSRIALRAS